MTHGINLIWADYTVIGVYLAATFAIGLVSAIREQRKTEGSSTGYFLAGRSMSWWTIALSLYMSNIGSNTFIGTAGSAAANGFGVLCYEFVGIYSLLLLAYMFVPIYLTSDAFTMPEYIKKRFGGRRMQILLAVQSLLMYVFAKLSLEVYAGSLIIQNTMGWNEFLSISILLVMTGLYTVIGGLTTVIITDAVQGIVVVLGSGALAIISINSIGGIGNLRDKFMQSYPADYNNVTGCGQPDPHAFSMLRDIADPNYPWLGAFVGANILSAWHWCTDQLFVQRTLAAKSLQHAKAGSVAAGFLKVLPLLLMIVPGMISRIHYADVVACVGADECERACGVREGCSNIAYVEIIKNMLPVGVRGIMIAAMLAALISSITSIFNSGSTLFTIDLWTKFRPGAKELEKVIVGRLFIVALTIIGVAWLPVVKTTGGGQLVIYAQSVTSYLTPPILSVFLLASLWPRTTEPAVFWGLLVSMVIGVAWMILNFVFSPPSCGEVDSRPSFIANLHFLHFAILLLILSLTVMVVISFVTEPLPRDELAGLTWFTQRRDNRDASPNDAESVDGVDAVEMTETEQCKADEAEASADPANYNVEMKLPPHRRLLRFAARWLCGMPDSAKAADPQAEAREAKERERKAEELRQQMRGDSNFDKIVDGSALLLFGFGCFLWGLFA